MNDDHPELEHVQSFGILGADIRGFEKLRAQLHRGSPPPIATILNIVQTVRPSACCTGL